MSGLPVTNFCVRDSTVSCTVKGGSQFALERTHLHVSKQNSSEPLNRQTPGSWLCHTLISIYKIVKCLKENEKQINSCKTKSSEVSPHCLFRSCDSLWQLFLNSACHQLVKLPPYSCAKTAWLLRLEFTVPGQSSLIWGNQGRDLKHHVHTQEQRENKCLDPGLPDLPSHLAFFSPMLCWTACLRNGQGLPMSSNEEDNPPQTRPQAQLI